MQPAPSAPAAAQPRPVAKRTPTRVAAAPATTIEILTPDFLRKDGALEKVVAAKPDVFNHNLETVERLQRPVRKRARYDRSLQVLARAKAMAGDLGNPVHTKSSIMVGLGESHDELLAAFRDLRAVDCDILTIGQYLRPSMEHLPLERYYTPEEFAALRREALAMGFRHVESGPLVRSSYHARDQVPTDSPALRGRRARGQGLRRRT